MCVKNREKMKKNMYMIFYRVSCRHTTKFDCLLSKFLDYWHIAQELSIFMDYVTQIYEQSLKYLFSVLCCYCVM